MAGCLRASSATCILVLFVVFGISYAAKDILVGGKVDACKVPSSPSDSLNKWAERASFQVGDRLEEEAMEDEEEKEKEFTNVVPQLFPVMTQQTESHSGTLSAMLDPATAS
ncbi:hypothetical protein Ahy_A02g009439 [Arachis hypogaea]|uniref:Uncharacterized protein n=1 Tax=Arachis hypogaea TaxID=3818 RepID=A0A445EH89_ARAHY|nr:hypothetical protein Ahy_A02g009439 [Arachis hypogaea]